MEKKQVLVQGYCALVESWGNDERIVEAARMSTGKGFLGWGGSCDGPAHLFAALAINKDAAQHLNKGCPKCKGSGQTTGDEKLLKYLWENKHGTPFEMAGMTVEIQAPIVVFREWHRHRTQSYNEMSARYSPLPDVNYVPTVERCMIVSGANKQAGAVAGAEQLTHESALEWLAELAAVYEHAERVYQSGLRRGIPKEVARLPVPVGRYSRMRASANLRNWLSFLTLRSDHVPSGRAAQWEIRQFANAVGELIAEAFPRTWALFAQP
jgi:thymidylate synthase (FAD)